MEMFLHTNNVLQNFHIFAQKKGVFAFFVQIQCLKVFSKDMKHLYADNIQFGGGLNFWIKYTMSTLIFTSNLVISKDISSCPIMFESKPQTR